jgi:hypothetical protein
MLGENSDWLLNVRAAGGRAVLRHGRREAVCLEEVDPGARAPIVRRFLSLAPGPRAFIPVARLGGGRGREPPGRRVDRGLRASAARLLPGEGEPEARWSRDPCRGAWSAPPGSTSRSARCSRRRPDGTCCRRCGRRCRPSPAQRSPASSPRSPRAFPGEDA